LLTRGVEKEGKREREKERWQSDESELRFSKSLSSSRSNVWWEIFSQILAADQILSGGLVSPAPLFHALVSFQIQEIVFFVFIPCRLLDTVLNERGTKAHSFGVTDL